MQDVTSLENLRVGGEAGWGGLTGRTSFMLMPSVFQVKTGLTMCWDAWRGTCFKPGGESLDNSFQGKLEPSAANQ